MLNTATFIQYNEHSILIQFDTEINQKLLNNLLSFKNVLLEKEPKQILQIINTYNSLLIIYRFTINKFYDKKNEILKLLEAAKLKDEISNSVLEIPVCYDEEFGIDLQEISSLKSLETSEIIKLHSEPKYLVYFIGFLPGFPYLGGLNSKLFSRRKSQPRSNINAGAVGIGGEQTGIYPISSPGGWQIIGQTPIPLFDFSKSESKTLLNSGQFLKFMPISKSEFQHIENNLQDYELKSIKL
ncbi:5-oxoprolinase subunit PxpB [Psychroflexus aestuariivivens]|uniref:5-oxoprolinase subunit PxpB n=1 Tax=Psychroflexus aestuariivivens TaxID=1795040 RepID=UPI000FD711B2|nr:5-oxoprolinase subunit PxpB [Psychroflexus aestuariivivens]